MTNKRLVKALMDTKGIDMITISSDTVVAQVSKKFTPAMAHELCQKVGHAADAKAVTSEQNNYIIFPRF